MNSVWLLVTLTLIHLSDFGYSNTGRRSCPGLNMGLQMLHLTIARLLQGFDMATPSNSPVDIIEGISVAIAILTFLF